MLKSFQVLRNFYIATIVVIFMISMIMQIPRLKVKDNIKITVFVSWAAFGVIPTFHWYFEMGGNENTMVNVRLVCTLLTFRQCRDLPSLVVLDFHSARHRNVRARHYRVLNLHHQNPRTLAGRQS